MDRIEFVMNPQLRDFKGAMTKRLLVSRFLQVYYLVVVALVITMVAILPDDVNRGYEAALAFGSVAALSIPFGIIHGYGRRAFRSCRKCGDMSFFLDQQGYGGRSDVFEFCMKWKGIDAIHETKKYVLIKLSTGQWLVIFKYLLSDATVCSIKKLLRDVPVTKKVLLA